MMLTFSDRAEIATGLKAGWGVRAIASQIGRSPSVGSREVRRNSTRNRGYRPVAADCRAERRRGRRQERAVGADPVLRARIAADLRRSRTPRQIAGRLRLEAADPSVGVCQISGVRAFLVSFFVHSKMDLRPRTYCDLFRVIRLAGCPASASRLSLRFSGEFLFRGVSRAFPARGVSFPAFPGQCCQVGAVLPGGGCLVQAGGG